MGAPPDYSRSAESRDVNNVWRSPVEEPDEIGSPGAWYRSAFVDSIMRYYRRRDDSGNRIANPTYEYSEDPLVHEAVILLETHEDEGLREHLVQIRNRSRE